MKRVILCDFDGTITTHDITNTLCRMHIPERWAEIERMWESRQISATECYKLEYEALGFCKDKIDAFVATIGISPGLGRLLEATQTKDWEFHVISAGFDYYIEAVLKRCGIHLPYTANGMRFTADGRPQFDFLVQDDPTCTRFKQPCSGCKPVSWDLWKERGYQVAYIGDGSTDFCMADHFKTSATPSDLLFAKKRLLAYCREQAIPAIPFGTLDDVATYLEHLAEPEKTLPLRM